MNRKQSSVIDNAAIPSHHIDIDGSKQNLGNKKIYFDADGTEIKIGYDDVTGVGFVEIISE